MNYFYRGGPEPIPDEGNSLCWKHAKEWHLGEGEQVDESLSPCVICGMKDEEQEIGGDFDLAAWLGVEKFVTATAVSGGPVEIPDDPIQYPSPSDALKFYKEVLAPQLKQTVEQPTECDDVAKMTAAFFYMLYPQVVDSDEHRFSSNDALMFTMLDLHALGHVLYRMGFIAGRGAQ